jgi:hypothetical protein
MYDICLVLTASGAVHPTLADGSLPSRDIAQALDGIASVLVAFAQQSGEGDRVGKFYFGLGAGPVGGHHPEGDAEGSSVAPGSRAVLDGWGRIAAGVPLAWRYRARVRGHLTKSRRR